MGMSDGVGDFSSLRAAVNFEMNRKIATGMAIDFVDSGAQERCIYIFGHELECDGLDSLPEGKCVKIVFTYSDIPD